jgi:hypothetical protein
MRALTPEQKFLVIVLVAIAGGLATFLLSMIALLVYAQVRYEHPGSTTGAWAFINSIPAGIAGAVVSPLIAAWLLRSRKQ